MAGSNTELLREERLRGIEQLLLRALNDARAAGLNQDQLHEMLDLLADER